MDISANDLTKWAKKYLETLGFRLNRVNNIPYGKRKGTIQKGWADLQGYNDKGIYAAIEVKKIGDKLSLEQRERLKDIYECGGIVYICTEIESKPALVEWSKMKF
ncbi:MAG: VRR-NUC domain-containing protein [Sediminibacterium sp.]